MTGMRIGFRNCIRRAMLQLLFLPALIMSQYWQYTMSFVDVMSDPLCRTTRLRRFSCPVPIKCDTFSCSVHFVVGYAVPHPGVHSAGLSLIS